jgi:DNA-binding GntR family transcriptional regulator
VSLTRKQADLLGASRGAAALLVVSVGRLGSGDVLWCEETFYRGDSYVFQNVLGGVEGRRPAIGKLVSNKDA